MRFTLLASLFIPAVLAASKAPEIEEGFEKVTCGSTIKLANQPTGYRLHSHGVTYGSGSGQQSITAFPEADDSNSFWFVQGGNGNSCKRGTPIACGSTVRLKHVNTKGYLHSHSNHPSPLSRQQEVSCFDGQDSGDDWRVECQGWSTKYWIREEPIELVHVDSKVYLSSNANYRYGHPIPGQLEVAGAKSRSKGTKWIAQEGIYFAENA